MINKKDVQLVIPMSGIGKRFLEAGYYDPKPLIEVDGKPIIAHVLDMFPGVENYYDTFSQEGASVCCRTHFKPPRSREARHRELLRFWHSMGL